MSERGTATPVRSSERPTTETDAPLRVLIAEDEEPLRLALCALVASEAGMEVVGAAASAEEAIELAAATSPQVGLVDVRMPGGGPMAVRGIRERSPETWLLALSAYEDQATVLEMLSAGAVGYLVKGVSPVEVVEAIHRAARGQASLSVEVISGVIDELTCDMEERRKTEKVLRRSEEKFRDMIESSPDAVVIVDGGGKISIVNAETEQLFGYDRDELLGRPIEILIPERFHARHLEHRAEYMLAPATRPMGVGPELTGRRKDRTEFPVDISLSTIETDEGPLITARVRDITERRHAEEVRRKSEERFAALLESAPDAVVIIDESGKIVLVNDQTEKVFGYSRGELIDQAVEILLPERFRQQHTGDRSRYFLDPRTRPMGADRELAGRRKDGSEFPVDVLLSAIETDEGRLGTAFIRDVTERKQADEARRKTEEHFGELLESAPVAVVIADGDGLIQLVNAQTERIFGYGRRELLGKAMETLFPERFHERHVEHRAEYLADSGAKPLGAGLDLAGRRKDGSEFPVEISLSTITTDDRLLLTAFIHDISERQAEAELAQALADRRALLAHVVAAGEEERRRIAGGIHDDSIQAITAASMRLQILRRALSDADQLALLSDLEETIQLSIFRLRQLLFELRPPVLDKEGLAAALQMYITKAAEETETRYRLESALRTQPSQEARLILYRIAQEALTNVRKHAQATSVTVTLEERDAGYLVRVADDGVAFSTEDMRAVPGHLGLAAMRERAALAGGWLRIEAEPGKGALVEVWIPALPTQEPEAA